MSKRLWLVALFSVIIPISVQAGPWQDSATTPSNQASFASDHVVVKYKNGTTERVPVAAGSSVLDTIKHWSKQSNVAFVEPDGLVRALGQTTSWGYDQVQAAAAATTNGATGAGIIVAVVDTGVDYLHEDLDANRWVNVGETAGNGVDDDGNGYIDDYYGYDFIGSLYTAVTPDNDPEDEYGHGTHVSGIIAAENNTVGVRGVASSATIMPVKVLDSSGYGYDSTIADGIHYAVDNGANIINLSLGTAMASNTMKAAIDYAETNGVLVVAAAGNSYSYTIPSYPAAYASVVSVGSTNEDGYKSDFSNWGKVNVIAPGESISSSIPGNKYEKYSGTSMASPHVAGVAALIMQKFSTTNPRAVRQILQNTADDFGSISGVDYLSGYGAVNALDATGTQTASAILYADTGTLVTDGSAIANLTVSVRDASNAAVVGDTISWSTSAGTLSTSSSTTDANGLATITLTADDVTGLVTITADPATTAVASLQLALLSDVPTVTTVGLQPITTSDSGDVLLPATNDKPTGGDSNGDTTSDIASFTNQFAAGDDVTMWAYVTEHDIEAHDVTLTYSVTDPDGTAVADLSGTSAQLAVGLDYYGMFYLPQTSWTSIPLTIPAEAVSGEYTISITATEDDTSESSTHTGKFWVGEGPKVLVVDNDGYCYDAPIEGLSYGGATHCVGAADRIVTALDNLDYNAMVWNVTKLGTPAADVMSQYPVVIWLDATFSPGDTTAMQSYLDAGGNMLISSESLASSLGAPSDFGWNYLHAQYVSTIYEPATVVGTTTYSIDPYVISSSGTHANYSVDELTVNTADDAESIFNYTLGKGVDKSAGVQVDNDTYRLMYLSFGIEGINDSGTATLDNFLSGAMSWLRGTKPTISSVRSNKFTNSKDRTITIHGTNFQKVGTTKVKLRQKLLNDVVVESRTKITATVPAGMGARRYSVKVVNPDGRKVTRANAVRITSGGLYVGSLSTNFVSNNVERDITLTGQHFKHNATVWIGKTQLSNVTWNDSTSLTAKVPVAFKSGSYTVKVKNPAGTVASKKHFIVRVGFTKDLNLNDVDKEITALEKRLKKANYFTGQPDKTFDGKTEEALLHYQTDNTLSISGKLDANTRLYLNTN